MSFSHPWAFLLFTVVAALAVFTVAAFRRKEKIFGRMGDAAVLKRLFDPRCLRQQKVKAVFQLAAASLFVLTLAGPRWGQKFEEMRRRGVDVIIALDLSESMLAEDIKPNRLTQAKRELGLLINNLDGDRAGVVAFAGSAFMQCPLTLDYGAAKMLLNVLDISQMPVPGTNLADAIDAACDAFGDKDKKHKALVLLTDGEDHSGRLDSAVGRAKDEGVKIFAIGFGNPEGEVIPVRDENGNLIEYKKDKDGKTVVSKLGEQALRDVASTTGGAYYRATNGEVEVDRIAEDIHRMEKKLLESKVYDQYEDRYMWPLVPLLLLLILEFLWPETPGHVAWLLGRIRRRFQNKNDKAVRSAAAALLLIVILYPVPNADAMGRSPDSAGTDPAETFNRGVSKYGQKDFKAAEEDFESARGMTSDPALQSRSAYNAGNALFRQARFDEAVEKYKQALRLNPADADAKHNLEFARRVQKAAQKSKSDKKSDKDEKGDDKQQQSSGEKKDQDKDQQGRGQQDKEQEQKQQGALAKPKKDQMSKEDAERLLQAIQNQEMDARRKAPKPEQQNRKVEEDW